MVQPFTLTTVKNPGQGTLKFGTLTLTEQTEGIGTAAAGWVSEAEAENFEMSTGDLVLIKGLNLSSLMVISRISAPRHPRVSPSLRIDCDGVLTPLNRSPVQVPATGKLDTFEAVALVLNRLAEASDVASGLSFGVSADSGHPVVLQGPPGCTAEPEHLLRMLGAGTLFGFESKLSGTGLATLTPHLYRQSPHLYRQADPPYHITEASCESCILDRDSVVYPNMPDAVLVTELWPGDTPPHLGEVVEVGDDRTRAVVTVRVLLHTPDVTSWVLHSRAVAVLSLLYGAILKQRAAVFGGVV